METKALKDICQIIAGQSPPSDTYNQEQDGVPFFQGKADFGDLYPTVRYWCNAPKKLSKADDILFSLRAPVGPTNINNIDACIGRGLAAIRCENVQLKYLLHYLRGNEHKIAALGTGSTFKAITIGTLKDLEIPLPPLEEQKKIAAILDAADDYRQKTKALIDKYDQLTQSLFLDMFGDPVTNPKGWDLKKMGEVSTLKMGGTPSTTFENYYSPKEVRWLKSGDIKKDFITEFPNYISNEGLTNSNTKLYDENTVVMALNGQGKTRGTTGILTKKSCSNQSVANIDPDPSILNFVFLHFQLKYRYSHLRNLTGDNDRSGLNLTVLRNYAIILPHNAIQNQFAERVAEIEKQKQQAEASLVKAEELFSSLLQRAFKGELTS